MDSQAHLTSRHSQNSSSCGFLLATLFSLIVSLPLMFSPLSDLSYNSLVLPAGLPDYFGYFVDATYMYWAPHFNSFPLSCSLRVVLSISFVLQSFGLCHLWRISPTQPEQHRKSHCLVRQFISPTSFSSCTHIFSHCFLLCQYFFSSCVACNLSGSIPNAIIIPAMKQLWTVPRNWSSIDEFIVAYILFANCLSSRLSGNSLTGPIPITLCSLTSLTYL